MESKFYQGTTPTLIFQVKPTTFDVSTIDICHITLKNVGGSTQKTFNAIVDPEERTLHVTLTQEDTLAFESGKMKVQGKFKLNNGKVIASKEIITTLNEILERTIL